MTIDPAALQIVSYPAPVLRQVAEPVPAVTDEVRAVAERMLELMMIADGVGLAAPQVGLPWRMFVTRGGEYLEGDHVYINPEMSDLRGDLAPHEEGCLSLPNITGDVRRPAGATITATGLDGERFTLSSDGFIARVWQHEFDHLNGVLIIDKFGRLDRMTCRKSIRALEAAAR